MYYIEKLYAWVP